MTDPKPSSIEAEMDEIRERLAGTIDELLYRTNPKTIANRRVAALKAVYVDPESGEVKTTNVAKTVGGVVGAVAIYWGLRKIRNRD